MRIIIVGGGKMGGYLSNVLIKENYDVTVIDKNEDVLNKLNNTQDISTICGNGLVVDTLIESGVKGVDVLISSTKNDEDNILCCILAKKLGAKNTIARVRNPEYAKSMNYIKEDLGLSMTINPELLTAREIANNIRFPESVKPSYLSKGKIELVEFKIKDESPLIDLSIKNLKSKFKSDILVVVIERNDEVYIPNGNFVFSKGDKVIITSKVQEVTNFLKKIGNDYLKIKDVMIIGGSKVSYYLARFLTEINMKVKIIEMDNEKCKFLASTLPKALVINGDGSDKNLLIEEGIENVDAFVAATGIDEENVVYSMFANTLDIPKVITKINHLNFGEMLESVGLESVLTPHVIASNQILRYIRAKGNSKGGSMESLLRLIDDKVEIMEFIINKDFKYIGKPLKEINFKDNLIIVCINRKGNIIFPTGDDTLEANDNIIIATTKSGIKGLNDILG